MSLIRILHLANTSSYIRRVLEMTEMYFQNQKYIAASNTTIFPSCYSYVCETMEKIINDHIVRFLELNDRISILQYGVEQDRSTLPHLRNANTKRICEN